MVTSGFTGLRLSGRCATSWAAKGRRLGGCSMLAASVVSRTRVRSNRAEKRDPGTARRGPVGGRNLEAGSWAHVSHVSPAARPHATTRRQLRPADPDERPQSGQRPPIRSDVHPVFRSADRHPARRAAPPPRTGCARNVVPALLLIAPLGLQPALAGSAGRRANAHTTTASQTDFAAATSGWADHRSRLPITPSGCPSWRRCRPRSPLAPGASAAPAG